MVGSGSGSQLKDHLLRVEKLCREVGEFQMQHWQMVKSQDIADKGLNQLVSFVDQESEQRLMAGLLEILPGSCFIGEEFNPDYTLGEEPTWIIDPLDGTTNFLHGLPIFAVSVALHDAGKTQLGVVHAPAMGETFTATLGGGAHRNGVAMKLEGEPTLSQSLIATGFPYCDFEKMLPYLELLSDLMRSTHGLRRMGSAAIDLAYTAAGKFDAFYEMGLAPWDVAAGALLVEEAGGIVSNFSGESSVLFQREILASHPALALELLQRVSDKLG